MILISKIEIDEKNHGLTVIDSYSSFDVTSTTSNARLIEIPMRLEFKMRELSIKRNCIFPNDVDNTTIGRHDFIDRRWAECFRLMFEWMFIREPSNCSLSGSANGVWHVAKKTRKIETCSINVPTGNFGDCCNCRYTHRRSLTANVLIIIFLQLIYLSLISITKLNQFLMIISLIYIFKRHISLFFFE